MSDKKLEEILTRIKRLEEDSTKDHQERSFLKQKLKGLSQKLEELSKIIYSS